MAKEGNDENSILHKIIESWNSFEYSLKGRRQNCIQQDVNECQKEEYTKAFNTKDEYNSTESLFMALIFKQQKMGSQLIDKLSEYK